MSTTCDGVIVRRGKHLRRPDLRVRRPWRDLLLGALALGCVLAPPVGCAELTRTQKADYGERILVQCVEEQFLLCIEHGSLTQCIQPGYALAACAGG